MPFHFKSSHLVSSISLMTLAVGAVGLALSQSTTQKSIAQQAPAVVQIKGAGATFPTNLYLGLGLFNTYGVAVPPAFNTVPPINPNVQFAYAPVGSGAGINAFLSQSPPPLPDDPTRGLTIVGPLSFGATDVPLNADQLAQYARDVQPTRGEPVQVPVATGAIALPFNPEGLNVPQGGLRLSRATYCGIFNGNITNFNDARITTDNRGVVVSTGLPITIVRRRDSSGTTSAFTAHLTQICAGTPSPFSRGTGTNSAVEPVPPEVQQNPASQNTVFWPVNSVAADGNPGVVATVNSTAGGIGYAENSTVAQARGAAAVLQNRAGQFVAPSPDAVTAAFQDAPIRDDDQLNITQLDPGLPNAYPIVTPTYLLFYGRYDDPAIAFGIKGFINYVLQETPEEENPTGTPTDPTVDPTANPDTIIRARGFAPLPARIKAAARLAVTNNIEPLGDPGPVRD